LEQLERYVSLLESRVDLQDSMMRLRSAGIDPTALTDAEDAQPSARAAGGTGPGEDDPVRKRFDHLLRTIVIKQGTHETNLRTAVRGQEWLQSGVESAIRRLDSIEQILRDVQRKVQTLVTKPEC
jgi:hypothetical protein